MADQTVEDYKPSIHPNRYHQHSVMPKLPFEDVLEIVDDDEKFGNLKKEIHDRGVRSSNKTISKMVICEIIEDWKEDELYGLHKKRPNPDQPTESIGPFGIFTRSKSIIIRKPNLSPEEMIEDKIEELSTHFTREKSNWTYGAHNYSKGPRKRNSTTSAKETMRRKQTNRRIRERDPPNDSFEKDKETNLRFYLHNEYQGKKERSNSYSFLQIPSARSKQNENEDQWQKSDETVRLDDDTDILPSSIDTFSKPPPLKQRDSQVSRISDNLLKTTSGVVFSNRSKSSPALTTEINEVEEKQDRRANIFARYSISTPTLIPSFQDSYEFGTSIKNLLSSTSDQVAPALNRVSEGVGKIRRLSSISRMRNDMNEKDLQSSQGKSNSNKFSDLQKSAHSDSFLNILNSRKIIREVIDIASVDHRRTSSFSSSSSSSSSREQPVEDDDESLSSQECENCSDQAQVVISIHPDCLLDTPFNQLGQKKVDILPQQEKLDTMSCNHPASKEKSLKATFSTPTSKEGECLSLQESERSRDNENHQIKTVGHFSSDKAEKESLHLGSTGTEVTNNHKEPIVSILGHNQELIVEQNISRLSSRAGLLETIQSDRSLKFNHAETVNVEENNQRLRGRIGIQRWRHSEGSSYANTLSHGHNEFLSSVKSDNSSRCSEEADEEINNRSSKEKRRVNIQIPTHSRRSSFTNTLSDDNNELLSSTKSDTSSRCTEEINVERENQKLTERGQMLFIQRSSHSRRSSFINTLPYDHNELAPSTKSDNSLKDSQKAKDIEEDSQKVKEKRQRGISIDLMQRSTHSRRSSYTNMLSSSQVAPKLRRMSQNLEKIMRKNQTSSTVELDEDNLSFQGSETSSERTKLEKSAQSSGNSSLKNILSSTSNQVAPKFRRMSDNIGRIRDNMSFSRRKTHAGELICPFPSSTSSSYVHV